MISALLVSDATWFYNRCTGKKPLSHHRLVWEGPGSQALTGRNYSASPLLEKVAVHDPSLLTQEVCWLLEPHLYPHPAKPTLTRPPDSILTTQDAQTVSMP